MPICVLRKKSLGTIFVFCFWFQNPRILLWTTAEVVYPLLAVYSILFHSILHMVYLLFFKYSSANPLFPLSNPLSLLTLFMYSVIIKSGNGWLTFERLEISKFSGDIKIQVWRPKVALLGYKCVFIEKLKWEGTFLNWYLNSICEILRLMDNGHRTCQNCTSGDFRG